MYLETTFGHDFDMTISSTNSATKHVAVAQVKKDKAIA